MDVFILYRDMRTYGEKELLYKEARELGVIFVRFDLDGKPQVEQTADGKLQLTITDPILDRPVVLTPDLLALAVGGAAQSRWRISGKSSRCPGTPKAS